LSIFFCSFLEVRIVKKLPKRFPKRINDVYITNKTDFKAQLNRCEHLLVDSNASNATQGRKEIYLHAMGNAINRAINLALQLQKKTQCKLTTFTSTIEMEDDLLPLIDSLEISTQYRNVSSIHINLFLE
jgi:ribonuclease P/MRP protein subunit RPP20